VSEGAGVRLRLTVKRGRGSRRWGYVDRFAGNGERVVIPSFQASRILANSATGGVEFWQIRLRGVLNFGKFGYGGAHSVPLGDRHPFEWGWLCGLLKCSGASLGRGSFPNQLAQ
jgi:hypothetical protein